MSKAKEAKQFLRSLFEFEYCAECCGDVCDHIPCVGPFGDWFAMCKWTPIVDGFGFRRGKVIEAQP